MPHHGRAMTHVRFHGARRRGRAVVWPRACVGGVVVCLARAVDVKCARESREVFDLGLLMSRAGVLMRTFFGAL